MTPFTRFLAGLTFDRFEEWSPELRITGIYAVERPGRGPSWYYLSTYKNFGKHKNAFFNALARGGQDERADFRMWRLHHVVQKDALKPFFSERELKHHYDHVWPVVLLHEGTEHSDYTRLLTKTQSARAAFDVSGMRGIKSLYANTYAHAPVLARIASNVLRTIPG